MIEKQIDGALALREKLNEVIEELNKVLGVAIGPGLTGGFTPFGMYLSADPGTNPLTFRSVITAIFFGVIKSSTPETLADATKMPTNRFIYSFASLRKTGPGITPNAWTEGTISGTAFNLCEYINTKTTKLGAGVDPLNLPTGFTLQPAPAGVIIPVYQIATPGGAEYWFSYENAVDGKC